MDLGTATVIVGLANGIASLTLAGLKIADRVRERRNGQHRQ
jgi:hypothetical protein